MVDYSEGYLNLKRMVDDIWRAIMENDFNQARDLCAAATVEARLLRHQLAIQHDSQRESRALSEGTQTAGDSGRAGVPVSAAR